MDTPEMKLAKMTDIPAALRSAIAHIATDDCCCAVKRRLNAYPELRGVGWWCRVCGLIVLDESGEPLSRIQVARREQELEQRRLEERSRKSKHRRDAINEWQQARMSVA